MSSCRLLARLAKRSPLSAAILSKYLVQYVPETSKPAKKLSARRVFGFRES